jgi:hypothetical protein
LNEIIFQPWNEKSKFDGMIEELKSDNKAVDEIKSHMDALFIFSSRVPYSEIHPLRVVQASKSLIGINLNSPPKVLLKWLEIYIKKFEPNFEAPDLASIQESPEVISYLRLKELISDSREEEPHKYLGFLLKSATPISIVESLIELAAEHSAESFLYCWSALRSIQFMGEKGGYPLLYHCISNLVQVKKNVDEDNNLSKYEMLCHQHQIRKADMVRSSKINPKLDQLIQAFPSDAYQDNHWMPETLKNMIENEGVVGMQSYICSLKLDQISQELIRKLDSLRSVMLFSDYTVNEIIDGAFLRPREKQHA